MRLLKRRWIDFKVITWNMAPISGGNCILFGWLLVAFQKAPNQGKIVVMPDSRSKVEYLATPRSVCIFGSFFVWPMLLEKEKILARL
jgi:hypothetical protein